LPLVFPIRDLYSFPDGGLAKSAFDVRYARAEDDEELSDQNGDHLVNEKDSKIVAQSPAVDAGTDDAWEYDSTSTKSTVIDMSQPDIGYHYYRRIADDDPENDQHIYLSLRQPEFAADIKADGFGFYVDPKAWNNDTKEWESKPGIDMGYNYVNDAVVDDIATNPEDFGVQRRYKLFVKSYYWIDQPPKNGSIDPGELTLTNEENAVEVRLLVDRNKPEVSQ
jgi:hypothetical protein